jgi:cytoskeletal protein CcmA (bactofilin family)
MTEGLPAATMDRQTCQQDVTFEVASGRLVPDSCRFWRVADRSESGSTFAGVPRGGTSMISGRTIVIKGDISGNEDLVIAGRVEGSISLGGRVLTLAPESHVVGTISAASVIVSGTVEGTIVADERLELRSSAVIDGDLSTPALVVAEGATLNAMVEMPERTAQKPQLAGAA